MSKFLSLFLVFCLVLDPLAYAGPRADTDLETPVGSETVEVDFTIAPPSREMPSAEQLRADFKDAQQAFDAEDEDHGYFRKWAEKYNFPKIFLNAYRWYLMKSGGMNAADHLGNVAIMLLTSHTIETVGGGYLAGTALASDWHWAVKTLLTTGGIGISVPGLDPLCIGLGLAYGKWPQHMNAGLQYPRIVIIGSTSFLATKLGMKRFVPWVMSQKDGVKFLMEKVAEGKPGTYRWTTTVEGYQFELLATEGAPIATLKMDRFGDNALVLNELCFADKWDRRTRKRLAAQLEVFGWNVKAAVLEAFDQLAADRPEKLEKLKYVSSVTFRPREEARVRYHAPAISLGQSPKPTVLGGTLALAACAYAIRQYAGLLGF